MPAHNRRANSTNLSHHPAYISPIAASVDRPPATSPPRKAHADRQHTDISLHDFTLQPYGYSTARRIEKSTSFLSTFLGLYRHSHNKRCRARRRCIAIHTAAASSNGGWRLPARRGRFFAGSGGFRFRLSLKTPRPAPRRLFSFGGAGSASSAAAAAFGVAGVEGFQR